MARPKRTAAIRYQSTSNSAQAPTAEPASAYDQPLAPEPSSSSSSSSNMNSKTSSTFLDSVEGCIDILQRRAIESRDEMHKLRQQLLTVEGNHLLLEKELETIRAMISKERQKADAHVQPLAASAPTHMESHLKHRRSNRREDLGPKYKESSLQNIMHLNRPRNNHPAQTSIAEPRVDPLEDRVVQPFLPRPQLQRQRTSTGPLCVGVDVKALEKKHNQGYDHQSTPHPERPTITDNISMTMDSRQRSIVTSLPRTSEEAQIVLGFNHAFRLTLGSLPSPPLANLPSEPVTFPQNFIGRRLGGNKHAFSTVSTTKFTNQVFRCTDIIKLNPEWHHMAARQMACHTVMTLIDGLERGDEGKRYTLFYKAGTDGWVYSGEYQIIQRVIIPPEVWDTLDEDVRMVHARKIETSSAGQKLLVEKGLVKNNVEAGRLDAEEIMEFFARRQEPCLRVNYIILQCLTYNRVHYDLLCQALEEEQGRSQSHRFVSQSTTAALSRDEPAAKNNSLRNPTTSVPTGEESGINLNPGNPLTPGRRYVQQTIQQHFEGSPEKSFKRHRHDDQDDDDIQHVLSRPTKRQRSSGIAMDSNRARRALRHVDYRLMKSEDELDEPLED